MEPLQWHNEKRKVKDLIPWDKNPRKLSEEAKNQLEKSLSKFSLVEIPAINLDNKIIAGHQRTYLMMLQGKGEQEIDVRVPNRMLTDEEYKEYNLRSNKNTGEWDFDVLAFFEEDILKDVGFTGQEMDKIFKGDKEDDFDADKEAEKIVEPVAKHGEIYQLGRHKLMCGDSSKVEDVDKLMGGDKRTWFSQIRLTT